MWYAFRSLNKTIAQKTSDSTWYNTSCHPRDYSTEHNLYISLFHVTLFIITKLYLYEDIRITMPRKCHRPTFSDIADYMQGMRHVGHFVDDVIVNMTLGRGNGSCQFIIACLVSARELRNGDDSALKEFTTYITRLRRINCDDGYLCHGRVAVLKNDSQMQHNSHGEARLLDPCGSIRSDQGVDIPYDEFDEPVDYMDELESAFKEKFGTEAKSYLLIFSHYIPCTLDRHQCSNIIGEYAKQTTHKVYVGYDEVYKHTDKDDALNIMLSNGVGVIFPHQL